MNKKKQKQKICYSILIETEVQVIFCLLHFSLFICSSISPNQCEMY